MGLELRGKFFGCTSVCVGWGPVPVSVIRVLLSQEVRKIRRLVQEEVDFADDTAYNTDLTYSAGGGT